MPNYMTRNQWDRHKLAVHELEEKLHDAQRRVGEAASHGDLSENAEFDAAVEECGFLSGRDQELKDKMVGCTIVDPKRTEPGFCSLGKSVTIKNADTDEISTYHIVGDGLVNTDGGEISYKAPTGAALLGKRKGDRTTVQLPDGPTTFEILEVEYYLD